MLPDWCARHGGAALDLERRLFLGRGALHPRHGALRICATHPGFDFQILATDISTRVLEKAERGVFTPSWCDRSRRHWSRSTAPEQGLDCMVRIVPGLREKVAFAG